MALCIWSFMCARCDELVLLCTRCLRGRRYCDTCAAVARRCSVREAGRRYQRSAKGRRAHRRRSQRYRAAAAAWSGSRRQREPPGVQLAGPSVGAPLALPGATTVAAPPTPPAVVQEAGRVPESAAAPCVTHQSHGPLAAPSAKIALMATVACKTGEVRGGERRASAWDRPALGGVAPPGDAPVRAQCSCCGRRGELVRFDGRPVTVCGVAPGDAAEEV